MRKILCAAMACLLLACLFACDQAQPAIATTAETTTKITAIITTEIPMGTTETTTEITTTTTKPTTSQGPRAQEILDSGVYTIRGVGDQGSVVIVSDGGKWAMETEMDWKAMAENDEAQAALLESSFGRASRMLVMGDSFYMAFPERKKYIAMGALFDGEELPVPALRCVQEAPYTRVELGQGADAQTLVVTSLSPKAEQRYFSLDGYQAMPLSDLAVLGGGLGPAQPARPGLFGRLFRFFW